MNKSGHNLRTEGAQSLSTGYAQPIHCQFAELFTASNRSQRDNYHIQSVAAERSSEGLGFRFGKLRCVARPQTPSKLLKRCVRSPASFKRPTANARPTAPAPCFRA